MNNNIIGLMVEDSPALTVGIMGILKSGNTFVPVNPVFPEERIHFIIDDCRIGVLVADETHFSRALGIARESREVRHVLCLNGRTGEVIARHTFDHKITERARHLRCDSALPAYIIYTSGSTGRPKGVPITHRNLVPLLVWFGIYFRLGKHTRVMQNLSYTFDFGVFEILTTFLFGGALFMLDKKETGGFDFYPDFIENHGINTVHTTPAFFSSIVAVGKKMPTLEVVHLGGENLTGGLVSRISELVPEDCRIYNGYGPTEATINCSIYCVTARQGRALGDRESIPIGKPSAHNKIYILNKHGRLQPVGAAGELCVAGNGLAHGYVNRPELTADRFTLNQSCSGVQGAVFQKSPLAAGGTIYRTGDLARWLPDGDIEFLGRIDQQVKIRGFRIELGEIESCLLKHEDIGETVVIARERDGDAGGGRYLCAYIVPPDSQNEKEVNASVLRRHLLKELPEYMVPAYFIHLDKIPLTANGKIDRRALPAPADDTINTGIEYAAPAGGTQERMARIWQEILGIGKIGLDDDFFLLGGDSILAGQCIARVREEFRVDMSLRRIFEQPSVRALSEEVVQLKRDILSIDRASRDREIPLSFAQERLWFLQNLDKNSTAYFVPRAIRIKGKLQVELLERTFTELIRRHEILRTAFPVRGGSPVQDILEPYPFEIPVIDYTQRDREVWQWISREGRRAFDLEKGPLLRVTLLKLKEDEHMLVLTEHHLIHDGWTQGVLLREFITLFTAFLEGKPSPLPELPVQYADFAVWQREFMQGEVLERHLDYWREKLSGLSPLPALSGDRPRPPVISGNGGMKVLVIPPSLTTRLKAFNKKEGVTLFMTMMAVFKVFLYRYSGVEDLCVGTGVANRRLNEIEGMLGMVINTLALRTRVSGGMTLRECLGRVKQTCLEAYEHEDTPFEKVVEALRPERNLRYTPIFQVLFAFMDTPTGNLELPGLELILEDSHNRSSKFDLNIVVVPPAAETEADRGEILVEWEYNSDIFEKRTIDTMTALYHRLLEEITTNTDERISALTVVDKKPVSTRNSGDNLEVAFNF